MNQKVFIICFWFIFPVFQSLKHNWLPHGKRLSYWTRSQHVVRYPRFSDGSESHSFSDSFALYAKLPPTNEQLAKAKRYLQMKELQRLKDSGASYDTMKAYLSNSTAISSNSDTSKFAYKKIVGRGTLDQRLRAAVALKRSYTTERLSETGMTKQDEEDLEEMMEDDEGDVEEEDDEDAMYESLVIQALEKNKLMEIQRNFLIDKGERVDTITNLSEDLPAPPSSPSPSSSSSSSAPAPSTTPAEELYVPARSSWGVYERPRDISKAYGGGRAITKEEMKRMDEEEEQRENERRKGREEVLTATQKMERENESKIREALSASRAFMSAGSRREAVAVLEKVQPFLSFQTDLGGDVLLELGMALETVERQDDARKIYGKLASVSWSAKVKRNALSLMQGLDITMKIRKDVGPRKPIVDMANMHVISSAIKKGLVNEWDSYKKKDAPPSITPWFDDGKEGREGGKSWRVDSFKEAYNLLLLCSNPLKDIPSSAIASAFRKIYLCQDNDKIALLKSKGLVGSREFFSDEGNNEPSEESAMISRMIAQNRPISYAKEEKTPQSPPTPSNSFAPLPFLSQTSPLTSSSSSSSSPTSTSVSVSISAPSSKLGEAIGPSLNGTWDILLTLPYKAPYTVQRFESGFLRRSLSFEEEDLLMSLVGGKEGRMEEGKDGGFFLTSSFPSASSSSSSSYATSSSSSTSSFTSTTLFTTPSTTPPKDKVQVRHKPVGETVETHSVMWGMATVNKKFNMRYVSSRCEIEFSGGDLVKSVAPWQDRKETQRTLQVLFCDDTLLVTRQVSKGTLTEPDLYTLWKRVTPAVWRKYS